MYQTIFMAHLLFTADFHELIKGKLSPGMPCRVNYDPLRFSLQYPIYAQQFDSMKVVCHCIYLPENSIIDCPMISEYGIVKQPVIEMDGTGSMLSCNLNIPANTTELTVWFTALTSDGSVLYDSEFGQNFHFRFKETDIISTDVGIANGNDGMDWVHGKFVTNGDVQSVELRYRLVNSMNNAENIIALILDESDGNSNKTWELNKFPVPFGSVLAYDYSYYIDGKRYKDDNNGNYFIVSAAT